MSKLWGPLGWMTLHSISLIYPENPSHADKAIVGKFIELFAQTITCHFCKTHFEQMLVLYTSSYPDFLNSRQDLAVFIFRAHNTVNKRLDKPIIKTVADCLTTLKNNTLNTSLSAFRSSYIEYLLRNWGREGSGSGMIVKHAANEMKRINNEYFVPREIDLNSIQLHEDNVLETIEKSGIIFVSPNRFISREVGFKGGKLKLARR
jgi:hypothetical protein